MALIELNTALQLHYAEIDADHQVFADLLNELALANNADFPLLFQQLYQHTEQHFLHEQKLMQQTAFPAEQEHSAEHRRVLTEFKQFKTRIDKGLISFGKSYVNERLPQWFILHVQTMDSALVAHLTAKA